MSILCKIGLHDWEEIQSNRRHVRDLVKEKYGDKFPWKKYGHHEKYFSGILDTISESDIIEKHICLRCGKFKSQERNYEWEAITYFRKMRKESRREEKANELYELQDRRVK